MTTDPSDWHDSPLYWLSVLASARKSRDRLLEEHARQQLARLGVRVIFGDDFVEPPKGGRADG